MSASTAVDCGVIKRCYFGKTVAAMDDAVAGSADGTDIEMLREQLERFVDNGVQIVGKLGLERRIEGLRAFRDA